MNPFGSQWTMMFEPWAKLLAAASVRVRVVSGAFGRGAR